MRVLILKWMLPKTSLFHFFKEDLDSFIFWERQKARVPMNYLDQANLTTTKLEGSRVHIDSKRKGLGVFHSFPVLQRKIRAWLEAIMGW